MIILINVTSINLFFNLIFLKPFQVLVRRPPRTQAIYTQRTPNINFALACGPATVFLRSSKYRILVLEGIIANVSKCLKL